MVRVVEAAATMSGHKQAATAKAIEAAMTQAALAAAEAGISDPDEVRGLKLAARDQLKAHFASKGG
jgi:hypothetical protein